MCHKINVVLKAYVALMVIVHVKNEQYVCTCPPGLVFIDQEKMILGCGRNFTAESCFQEQTYRVHN